MMARTFSRQAVLGIIALTLHAVIGCGATDDSRQFQKLYDIPAAGSPEVHSCQEKLPSYRCDERDCSTIVKLTDKPGLQLSPEHPSEFHFGSKALDRLMGHAAGITDCITKTWDNNRAPIVIGDVGTSGGRTPQGRHPSGSHDRGLNADISYFQTGFKDNLLRPVCDHGGNLCTDEPKFMDPYRTAVFMAGLHREAKLAVIGIDARTAKPLLNATKELCEKGIIKGNACAGLKLVWGNSWARFHHHHMHVRLGTTTRSFQNRIGVGDPDNDALWYSPGVSQDSDIKDPSPLVPRNANLAEGKCYLGFLSGENGKGICSVFRAGDVGKRAPFAIAYETDTCDLRAMAENLPRDQYNNMVDYCDGEYLPFEAPWQWRKSDQMFVALPSDATEKSHIYFAVGDADQPPWLCVSHNLEQCRKGEAKRLNIKRMGENGSFWRTLEPTHLSELDEFALVRTVGHRTAEYRLFQLRKR